MEAQEITEQAVTVANGSNQSNTKHHLSGPSDGNYDEKIGNDL